MAAGAGLQGRQASCRLVPPPPTRPPPLRDRISARQAGPWSGSPDRIMCRPCSTSTSPCSLPSRGRRLREGVNNPAVTAAGPDDHCLQPPCHASPHRLHWSSQTRGDAWLPGHQVSAQARSTAGGRSTPTAGGWRVAAAASAPPPSPACMPWASSRMLIIVHEQLSSPTRRCAGVPGASITSLDGLSVAAPALTAPARHGELSRHISRCRRTQPCKCSHDLHNRSLPPDRQRTAEGS